jgi:hypothetical protein
MRKFNLNKRASTLTNWVFVILMVSLFLVLFQTQVLDPMNTMYGNNLSTGLSTDADNNIASLNAQTNRSSSELDTAEVSTLSDGLTIVQVGSVSIGVWRTLRDFVSGRFVSKLLTDNLDFPPIVATVISIIILISLVFIIVRIFMRGVTP